MTERVRFLQHQGRRILLFDFSHLHGDDPVAHAVVSHAKATVAAQPPVQELLTLVDTTGASASTEIIERFKDLATHNKPYVLASAIVGVPPILKFVLRIISTVTGRSFAAFRTMPAAMDWLAAQQGPPLIVPEEYAELSL